MATRSQLVNLRIFSLNLDFDFTLDDKDYQGFTRDCVHEDDVQQAFVYNSVLYTNFFKKVQGQRNNSIMIRLTKERFDF